MDASEQCDDGPQNSDTLANACRISCKKPTCGDGVVDTGEQCDEKLDSERCAQCKLPSKSGGTTTGGAAGSTGTPGAPKPGNGAGEDGCSCRLNAKSTSTPVATGLLVALSLLMRRFTRRRGAHRRR